MTTALVFPGQGSQYVGMGLALADAFPVARQTFEEADDQLGFSLSSIAWEGPEEVLTETRNAQPALFVHSLAAFRVIEEELGPVAMAAGHSLGELSAHAAAGTFSFAEGLRAVRQRGELMFEAGVKEPGSMAAILGLEDGDVEALCERAAGEGHVVVPANYNSPGQIVVSGSVEGVKWCVERAPEAGARKAVPLNVSGAFHSPLMAPVATAFDRALGGVAFKDPRFPVVSNVTMSPVEDGPSVRDLLVRQLTSPVRWAGSVETMADLGVERFVEVGPGRVLAGLNRRIARGIPTLACGTDEDIQQFLEDDET